MEVGILSMEELFQIEITRLEDAIRAEQLKLHFMQEPSEIIRINERIGLFETEIEIIRHPPLKPRNLD